MELQIIHNVYAVSGLTPNTPYRFSVLAYNINGNGPRSIQLTVNTLSKIQNTKYLIIKLILTQGIVTIINFNRLNYDFL